MKRYDKTSHWLGTAPGGEPATCEWNGNTAAIEDTGVNMCMWKTYMFHRKMFKNGITLKIMFCSIRMKHLDFCHST